MLNFIPDESQEYGIAHLLQKSFAGLFWPPGLGKTATSLAAWEILHEKKMAGPCYVFSKVKVVTNTWPREINKWLPGTSYAVARGGEKKRIAALESGADFILINMENTKWFVDLVLGEIRKEKYKKRSGRWGKRKVHDLPKRPDLLPPTDSMLIIDESSKYRNHNAQRVQAIFRILEHFSRRYILTGSPAPRGLMNLWAQLFIVDRGESLGDYITHYRRKYFHPAGYGGYSWELKDGAAKKIYKAISSRILRIGEDALNLPAKTFIDRYVDLEEENRELYNEMERESIIELQSEKITAANVGVRLAKLRQLANGFIYSKKEGEKRKAHNFSLAKAEEVLELIEETQGVPALIGYEFESDRQALLEVLGEDSPIVDSSTSDKEFNKIEKKWNQGKLPYLIGQMDILANGLNFQDIEAIVIFYSLPWDYETYDQFYRRVWRKGQKFPVMVYRLLARDTVDDNVMLPGLLAKGKKQDSLLNHLEKFFMTRQKKFVRASNLTKVGPKEGMVVLVDFMKSIGQQVPKVKPDVKDPGGTLLSAVLKKAKSWTTSQREEVIRLLTKNESYDGATGLPTVKKMIEEVLCADLENPISEGTWKMWPGYTPRKEEKMATKKAGGFSRKASKKKSKKKASKKKVSKKKVSKKKASKKKVRKQKTSSTSFNEDTYYVKGENEKTPKMEIRQSIVKKVVAAKGRGVKANTLRNWSVEKLGLTEKRAESHILGCEKMGFIQDK